MSERPTVVILGCIHKAQPQPKDASPEYFWYRHIVEFHSYLKEIIEEHSVRSIGEEAAFGSTTSAAALAEAYQLPYLNLDIPISVQEQIKVRPACGPDQTGQYRNFEGSDKYRVAWDTVREFHMYETFFAFQREKNPSLLICGLEHQNGFRDLLSQWFQVVLKRFDVDADGSIVKS